MPSETEREARERRSKAATSAYPAKTTPRNAAWCSRPIPQKQRRLAYMRGAEYEAPLSRQAGARDERRRVWLLLERDPAALRDYLEGMGAHTEEE